MDFNQEIVSINSCNDNYKSQMPNEGLQAPEAFVQAKKDSNPREILARRDCNNCKSQKILSRGNGNDNCKSRRPSKGLQKLHKHLQ